MMAAKRNSAAGLVLDEPTSSRAGRRSAERVVAEERLALPNDRGKRPRLQLEFTPEAYERLQELRELTGARSNAEVLRKAMHVFDWILMRTQEEKYKLQLVKDDEVTKVEMLIP